MNAHTILGCMRKGVTLKQILVLLIVVLLLPSATPDAAIETERTNPEPGIGDYDVPFYPGGTYMSGVQSPGEFLGFEIGSRPVTHGEALRYFQYLDDSFPNAVLHTFGETFEGRALIYLTLTSRENAGRLEEINHNIGNFHGRQA